MAKEKSPQARAKRKAVWLDLMSGEFGYLYQVDAHPIRYFDVSFDEGDLAGAFSRKSGSTNMVHRKEHNTAVQER